MTLQKLLETFDTVDAKISTSDRSAVLDAAEIEALRQKGFEEGYASGWDDAKAAETEARQRVDAELERNIQNLAFTYHEAVDAVRSEIKGLVGSLIDGFFPDLVPDLIRENVRSELIKLADECVELPVEIVTSPDSVDLLSEMLERDFSLQIELVADPNLAPRQVFVRSSAREIEINLSPLLTALREQFNAIQHSENRAVNDE